jgi:D-alanine-D-alanine ligase
MKKLRVAVIYGGVSGEHEVSLKSAASVIAALDPKKYDVLPVRIAKTGRWNVDASLLPADRRAALSKGERSLVPDATGRGLTGKDGKPAERIDVAFPLVHGTGGEDGCLQGLFELAGIPYVGTGILGSAVGMDKVAQKKILAQEGFPVAPYAHFLAADWKRSAASIVSDAERRLGYPCFVKPANLGSSVGISKAHHRKELRQAIELALSYDRKCVIEKAVPEAREIECAVLGNDDPKASVLGEIIPSNEFYDYAAKYLDGKSKEVIPAELPKATAERVRAMAVRAFRSLDAAGLARVDFFVRRDTGDLYINEINTIPGFTSISMYPKLWAATGLPFPRLLDELVRLAIERADERKRLTRDFAVPAPTREKAVSRRR